MREDVNSFTSRLGFWIESIIEDVPIPFEVKHMVLLLVSDSRGFHLEFGGAERVENVILNLDYLTLEGEYFAMSPLEDINDVILNLEQAMDILLSKKEFSDIFVGKSIYIAIFNERIVETIKRGKP